MENPIEMNKSGCAHAAHEAQAPGGCAHHHSEKATELLSDEHRVIERVLAVVEKLTQTPVESAIENWKRGPVPSF